MKLLGLVILMGLVQGCDPYGFGYKKNPAYILNEAFEAVVNVNEEAFLDASGREALCVYGNPAGVAYLKDKLTFDLQQIELKPTVLESRYNKSPNLVGSPAYMAYYHERYLVDVQDKVSKTTLLKVAVDCDFGFEGRVSEKYLNLKPKKYKKKACLVTKVIPITFQALPITKRCEHLKVSL